MFNSDVKNTFSHHINKWQSWQSISLSPIYGGLEGLTSPDFGEVNPNVGLAKLLRLGVIITSESVMLGADAGCRVSAPSQDTLHSLSWLLLSSRLERQTEREGRSQD